MPTIQRTGTCLNAYEIAFPNGFGIPVRTYVVEPITENEASHESRGDMVSAVWDYWRENKHLCSGREYWVADINANRVAVPAGWELPPCGDYCGYSFSEEASFVAETDDSEHHVIICRVLQDAIKKILKESTSAELGPLWRCFGDYCQMPMAETVGKFRFCRRFSVQPVVLADNRFVIRIAVRTVCLDGQTLDHYYREGKVGELAELIEAKRADRTDRRGRPIGVHVWCDNSTSYCVDAEHLELVDIDVILEHAALPAIEQRKLAAGSAKCCRFKKTAEPVPLSKLRLVLNTDITSEQHRETIINPRERLRLQRAVRDASDGLGVMGHELRLAKSPLQADEFELIGITPPATRVKDEWQRVKVIPAPRSLTFGAIKDRARARLQAIDKCGFMRSIPINPAVAWPEHLPHERAKRMRNDLNYILKRRGIEFQFALIRYRDVEDLRTQLCAGNHDAVLAVLPEHSAAGGRPNDTHDQFKQRLDIPSKCIHHDNTLREKLVKIRPSDLDDAGRKELKSIRARYRLTLDHLLIKHGWMPFESDDPFHFNVHVGLDVGGQRNDTVVACLGHGFAQPDTPVSFYMHRIPIPVGKAEPIPTDALFGGMMMLFERVWSEAERANVSVNFDTVLFIRDGAMLGEGAGWNEVDALHRLRKALVDKSIVRDDGRWAVAEIHKRAEQWRMFDCEGDNVCNPLVGRCVSNLRHPNECLLATTGRPYLTQGTAQILKIVGRVLAGDAAFQDIVEDVAWGADMGLTRPDMGRSLLWVLHGADAGALQASKGYKLIGVTA